MLPSLDLLRRSFPAYRITREPAALRPDARPRYVAVAGDLSLHPYAVVTADPAEIRDALTIAPDGRERPGHAR
jgi:hypothetical protein